MEFVHRASFVAFPHFELRRKADFVFQWIFCTTAVSIVSGGVAERVKTSTFAWYALLMSAFIYPVVVAWTWGGGWLFRLHFVDLAGSGVVHLTGGVAALVGAQVVGPREGRFEAPSSCAVHNMPLVALGTLLLWTGWFGFNAGSIRVTDEQQTALAAHVALNTAISGAAGGITASLVSFALMRKPPGSLKSEAPLHRESMNIR